MSKEKQLLEEPKKTPEDFLEDVREIESLCRVYDLNDPASNKRLFSHLKNKKNFSTWIGRGFMLGLKNRTKPESHQRSVRRTAKIILCSFVLLIIILTVSMTYFKIQDEKEDAVLDYIRKERELARAASQEQQEQQAAQETESAGAAYEDVIQVELDADEDSGYSEDGKTKLPDPSSDEPQVLSEYIVMHNMYPDIIGWLQIEDMKIDYPVLQRANDEDYYLRRNFQGESDSKGSLFVDGRTKIWPLDQNIVIFGHNMSNRTMFGTLDSYLDYSFYKKHPNIVFDTIYSKNLYEIIAVVKTAVKQESDEGFRYYWLHNYDSKQDYDDLMDFIEANRLYDTGKKLSYRDQTIMLSTCEYSVDNGRLVVIARKM